MSNDKRVYGSRITPSTISITFDDGRPVVITRDNPNFEKIKARLANKDHRGLYNMVNPAEGIKSYLNGKVQIKGGQLFYNGRQIDSSIVPVIINMIKEGQDADHLIRFLVLLESNPSMHSRNQLWDFIRKNDIVIYTGDPVVVRNPGKPAQRLDARGYLVLYKGVRNDYYDQHSGKFLNKPGFQLEMPRSNVDDDQSRACSAGFHAGAFPYVKHFGSRKLLVLVNPADVVSVPHDSDAQKIRTCRYTILKEVEAATFSKIETQGFADDGQSEFVVQFFQTENDEKVGIMTQELVRALDVQHATDLTEEEFEPFKIVGAFLRDLSTPIAV